MGRGVMAPAVPAPRGRSDWKALRRRQRTEAWLQDHGLKAALVAVFGPGATFGAHGNTARLRSVVPGHGWAQGDAVDGVAGLLIGQGYVRPEGNKPQGRGVAGTPVTLTRKGAAALS